MRCPSEETFRSYAAITALAGCLLGTLSGCGWLLDDEGFIQDRRNAYRDAQSVPPPEVPRDLSATQIESMMVVPEVPMGTYRRSADFETPRPATLFARREERQVRIQTLGDRRWIVAPAEPDVVWPRIKQFLADNGVPITEENPREGEIVTDWLEVEDSGYQDIVRRVIATERAAQERPYHRLRLRLERAVRDGASEIHLAHEAVTEPPSGSGGDARDPAGDDANAAGGAENTLLSELATYLAADVAGSGVSFLAQTVAAEEKAAIVRDDGGHPRLRLRLDYARAWATVSTALENASVPVQEAEREAGRIRIRFDSERFDREDEPGFWSRLFGGGDAQALTLRLAENADAYDLEVYEEDAAGRAPPELAERVLSVIREFAS